MRSHLDAIRKFIGPVTKEQLRYVDSFVGENVALFMPVGGACFYALTPEHSHPSYMFVLNFDDQTSLKFENRTIQGSPGRTFALSPGIAHQELPSSTQPRYVAIFIEDTFFDRQVGHYPVKRKIILPGEFHDTGEDLLPLLRRFMIEADNNAAGSGAVLNALGIEICHSLIRSILNVRKKEDRITHRIEIDRTVEYIHSAIGEKLTVDKMAKIACMSPSHFSRVFKKEIGVPPMDYLNRVRMDRVKKLLLAGDSSITQIAIACGFGSPSYLSACFYRRFKMSPSSYCNKGRISKKKERKSKDRA